jgi:hypothetical protein
MIGMRRREFIAFVGGAAAASIFWPLTARAQQAVRLRRIGILLYSKQELANVSPMLRRLEALGYVDGKTIAVEYRDAEGEFERLPLAADELVRLPAWRGSNAIRSNKTARVHLAARRCGGLPVHGIRTRAREDSYYRPAERRSQGPIIGERSVARCFARIGLDRREKSSHRVPLRGGSDRTAA